MVLITRKRLPLRSSEFQDYELIVLLYSLPCGSTWAHNDRSLRKRKAGDDEGSEAILKKSK